MSENKDKLADVATDWVQRNGSGGISFRKLADEIGIKSSSVHYYYPEKSDLIRVLIDRYSRDFFVHLDEIKARRGKLQSKLLRFIDLFDQVAQDNKFCLCGMMAAEIGLLDKESRQLLIAFFTGMEGWLETLLKEHREELGTSVNPKAAAKVIVSGLEGALLLDRVTGGNERLKSQTKAILNLLA